MNTQGIIILIIGRILDVFSTWVWLSKTGWHTEDEIAPISKLILEKDGLLGLIIFNSLFIFFFISLLILGKFSNNKYFVKSINRVSFAVGIISIIIAFWNIFWSAILV